MQQPQHQAQQGQLHHQRAPGHKLGLPALARRLFCTQCQQFLLAGLQFLDQAADGIARAQILHQPALIAVGFGPGQLAGQRHAALQHRFDTTDADQLVGIVAGHPAQLGQAPGDLVGARHALAQARRIHALGEGQRGRFDVTHVRLQLLQGIAYGLGSTMAPR
ncbi:hypothetical protein G6F23_014214 [Rhizopus arrhizus]|nr:hypothetical protein G6F23_014214 [Rhizopus arrhizus]